MLFRMIQWLWGPPLGRLVRFTSFRPWLSFSCRDWRQWGVEWPCMLVDRSCGRSHCTPVWNYMWLRSRLGFPYGY